MSKKTVAMMAILALVAVFVSGCSNSEKLAAKARESFVALRQCESGTGADKLAMAVMAPKPKKVSEGEWLKLVGIANKKELNTFVQEAYSKEIVHYVAELKQLKGNPVRAKELQVAIIAAQPHSGRQMEKFGTSVAGINHLVMMNGLVDARKYGIPTSDNLKTARIPVPATKAVAVAAPKKQPHAIKAKHKKAKKQVVAHNQ